MTPPLTGGTLPPAAIDCEAAVRRLWDYLDGRLPARAHAEVEAHLAACALCPPHFDFARTMQRALAAAAPPPAPDDGEERLRARVRAALRQLAAADRAAGDGDDASRGAGGDATRPSATDDRPPS